LLAREGEHDRAARAAREAVEVAERTDLLNDNGHALVDLAQVLALAGRNEDAALELEKALELYARKGNIVLAERARRRIAELRT
jgi:tetratricopeptide (TPR) repeat protein